MRMWSIRAPHRQTRAQKEEIISLLFRVIFTFSTPLHTIFILWDNSHQMDFYEDKVKILETKVVLLYDRRKNIKYISFHLGLTENKVKRILERAARILAEKCLMCNHLLSSHNRCPDCTILLHFNETHCSPSCLDKKYYQHN